MSDRDVKQIFKDFIDQECERRNGLVVYTIPNSYITLYFEEVEDPVSLYNCDELNTEDAQFMNRVIEHLLYTLYSKHYAQVAATVTELWFPLNNGKYGRVALSIKEREEINDIDAEEFFYSFLHDFCEKKDEDCYIAHIPYCAHDVQLDFSVENPVEIERYKSLTISESLSINEVMDIMIGELEGDGVNSVIAGQTEFWFPLPDGEHYGKVDLSIVQKEQA